MHETDPIVPDSVVVETLTKERKKVKVTLIQTGDERGNNGTNMRPVEKKKKKTKSG